MDNAVNIHVQGFVQTYSFLRGGYFRVELLGLCQLYVKSFETEVPDYFPEYFFPNLPNCF